MYNLYRMEKKPQSMGEQGTVNRTVATLCLQILPGMMLKTNPQEGSEKYRQFSSICRQLSIQKAEIFGVCTTSFLPVFIVDSLCGFPVSADSTVFRMQRYLVCMPPPSFLYSKWILFVQVSALKVDSLFHLFATHGERSIASTLRMNITNAPLQNQIYTALSEGQSQINSSFKETRAVPLP